MAAMAEGGAVVRQGHLRKLKTMKKKYFVLRAETSESSARLEYYESEKKFRSGAAPRRVLPLKSCYNITRRLDLKQKHVIALFTKEEQLCIVAENEVDLHAWLTAILKQFRSDDASEELLHPIQHVWQVNVQKKGLGASKNIQGLYNLCLTDKTLTLVKIKSQNNVISNLDIQERVEYSLKNIRRCGDSECFFYMEVGRQTATGAGELWMHSDDSNIAQSMHSTIYHAMRNCAKETENEKDHIVVPAKNSLLMEGSHPLPARRQTYSDGRGRAGIYNDKGLCVGSCIRQCVCVSATYSIDDSSAAIAPLTPTNAENQPPNNTLTTDKLIDHPVRLKKHNRTDSLPTGCSLFQEPLKIGHTRTWSTPLTGDELDRAILEKSLIHSSCKTVNGKDIFPTKKASGCRRASTGQRFPKLSPAHTKNSSALRKRCETMPSRASSSYEPERLPPRDSELDGLDSSRDDIDSISEWYRTPRIPEEPDCCDIMSKDFMSMTTRGSSIAHSRTSSMGADEPDVAEATFPDGYLPMAPGHEPLGLVSSSGSVCSGTPSTDPRFSEYQLEPATAHISAERSTRAYSVGSRPAAARPEPARLRAYSAGARRPPAHHAHAAHNHAHHAHLAHHHPRASADDLMELDFSTNSPAPKMIVARTPPGAGFMEPRRCNVDEYVDMSPRNAGYVEMRPGERAGERDAPATPATPATPDGYVEMSYGRAPTRPIAIAAPRQAPRAPAASPAAASPAAASPDDRRRRREPRTPLGSQTLFHMSMESPSSPPESDVAELEDDHHYLSTVREISEDGRRSPEARPADADEVSSSPQYVQLVGPEPDEPPANPTAAKTIVRPDDVRAGVHYAALDLEPRRAPAAPAPRLYTQIDFLRSEKYAADAT
ncbi:insulin receptor substrate 2 isoform X1 [Nymphalis io]|uniref:insulin receptor substrate 2 isoform X1 n=1 Tax=Inachis io TaxID=171585 RepID=UPI0021673C17|nr:insulin receptor substrate 2 isoform X1 [Nymphalis io]